MTEDIMKSKNRLLVVCVLLPLIASLARAQGESALPFLLIAPNSEANGWGGVSTAVASENPVATLANPGQLGIFSPHNYFAATTYAPKTSWLPSYGLEDLTYNVSAINAGVNLGEPFDLPVPFSVGVGYSRVYLDLGEFIITGSGGPKELGRFHAYEKSENLSFAFGVDYFLKVGFGVNTKRITSSLSPVAIAGAGSSEAKVTATDYGLLVQAPIFDIFQKATGEEYRILPEFSPLADLTFGYARNNIGDKIVYVNAAQADPLPRNATIGMSMELGLVKQMGAYTWKWFTITLAREAEDLLITRRPDGSFVYQSGTGDISFFKHVIRGELSDNERVNLHKGWQINLAEFLYVRRGSFAESPLYGNRNYTTNGFGLRTRGLMKFIRGMSSGENDGTFLSFVLDHVDLSYDQAEYSTDGPLGGTTFHSIGLTIRQ